MKKLVILLLFTCIAFVYSQDKEPNLWKFRWGHSNDLRTFDLDSFQQKTIQTGFQWSGSSQMNNALNNTVKTGNSFSGITEPLNIPLNLILQPTWDGGSDYLPGYFEAVMMQYEPTLPLDSTNEGEILRPNDTTDPVFGFKYRRGTISTNPSDENYSRLVLKSADKPTYGGDRVLENIWPQPRFETREWDRVSGQTDDYLGRKWYIAINLRRLNPSTDLIKDDSVIIKVKVPITYWDDETDFIAFNKLPINHQDSIEKLHFIQDVDSANMYSFVDSRGYAQLMLIDTSETIEITRRMIPTSNDSSENITIYAEFHTNGVINEYFASEEDALLIRDIDIAVDYLGGLDVAIDYIRIESFNAHLMNRGEIDWVESDYTDHNGVGFVRTNPSDTDSGWVETINDSGEVVLQFEELYGQHYPIYNVIQSTIDAFKIKTNNWQDGKIFRFQYQDTENSSYYWWGALRYVNKFSNGLFMTRDGLRDSKLYDYYTNAPNRWVEYTYGQENAHMPAPYARNGSQDPSYNTWRAMGLKYGFLSQNNMMFFEDSLASNFETNLRNESITWDDLKNESNYLYEITNARSNQARYERLLLQGIHNDEDRINSFLFTGKPWYQYMLLYAYSIYDSVDYYKLQMKYKRTLTFEEFNLVNFGCILNGAKGIIVDGDQNRKFPDDIYPGNMGVGDHTKLNDTTDIYSNLVGDDFINEEHDTWDAYDYVNVDSLSSYMGVSRDRVYIGTKSYRDALYQLSTFCRANDTELMALNLAATYSKGYGELYTQDEDLFGTENLLNGFVNLGDSSEIYSSRIKKSLFDTMLDEPFDSTFVNMTLLRKDSVDLDSIFYIGIQNRRTDPLIYWTNPDSTSQKYLRFLSSAEFRDSCMNSPDSLLYQDYWWKRQGARKITIPFNYTYSDTNTYNLLRISEIGSDVDSLNQLWHRGEKYYDMVTDTVIGENRSLSFNLLPGQGKILKVEVLKPDTVAGFLDNYNQTNLISHPTFAGSDDIKYQLAFYRNSEKPDDPSEVYQEVQFIQSIPIYKNSQDENIFWDTTTRIPLSKLYQESIAIAPNSPEYWDCNKPAIVVRPDTSGVPYAYVVYTCKDSNDTDPSKANIVYAKINTMTDSVEFNKEIYELSFGEIERFGTPTINASANGNYIAWTDSTNGLFVAYDGEGNGNIDDLDSILDVEYLQVFPKPLLYPSFNTYSHIDEGEDNAGLVWYQGHGTTGGIYYTRVRYDEALSNLILSYNITFYDGQSLRPLLAPRTVKLGHLSTASAEAKPIIYRSLFDYDNDPSWCVYNRVDNINWVDRLWWLPSIKSVSLFHQDSMNINKSWKNSNISDMFVNLTYGVDEITSINSAQQDGIHIGGNVDAVGGDYNLNFTLDGAEIYQKPGYNGSQLFRYNSLDETTIDYALNSPTKAAVGKVVQLAKAPQPNTNNTNNMWKNRRVFETDTEDEFGNPIILASANLFYKSVYDNKLMNQGFIGFQSDSNDVYFDLPKLEDETESINSLPYTIETDRTYRDNPCLNLIMDDGLGTLDSLLVKDIQLVDDDSDGDKEMELTMYGNKNDDIKLFLMRNSDSTTMALTTPTSTTYPSNGTKLIYSILDSTGSTFTLIYEQNDTLASFTEKSFLGGLSTDDTVSYKSAIKNDPVKYILDFDNGANFVANNSDLLDFNVYPNPVSNTVTIQAILPETLNGNRLKNTLLELSITDITGRTILNQRVASGQVVNFDMTNYSKGAYNVKMRYTGSNEFEAVRKIIKE